ncbi:hypothetical protein [Permianibacter aggregans]|uniref:Uncharacterized protein n=1 Tax=Permianibacter aggregans TaxID=1510150 RepID=A0A4R6UUK5_9GAMM|nr:hypothetical protein [Permianibacter aggregans]QGX40120.1 hypothetical protein E2H98_10740 [Permianibacter aggregans]TDQ49065.1 hypothetical protein EV696_10539 [Permianibacter aggregans]
MSFQKNVCNKAVSRDHQTVLAFVRRCAHIRTKSTPGQRPATPSVKLQMRFILFLCLALSACATTYTEPDSELLSKLNPSHDEILLVVKVKSVKYTGLYPSTNCKSDACIPVHFWYVYEAEVLERLNTNLENKNISFANLQHAEYIDDVTRVWYVQLKDISGTRLSQDLGVSYRLTDHASPYFKKSK